MRFEETVDSVAALREIYPPVMEVAAAKAIDHIDAICRRYIAASPFLLLATRGADGRLDISPKGDPAGFVAVLDDHTLAIPDRPGNNRLDTFENILTHREISLIFLIPGNADTLRVSGKARLVRDQAVREKLAFRGRLPKLAVIVDVEEAFTHCPKCVVRSGLWSPEKWPDRSHVPTLAEAITVHASLTDPVSDTQEMIENNVRNELY